VAEAAPVAVTPTSWTAEARRFATALGLASLYGLGLGTREGGMALVEHALFTPLAIAAVVVLAVPSLYIGLAIFDAPVRPLAMAHAAACGARIAGLVLAGLAPAAALYVVSSAATGAAAAAATCGLFVAAVLGLRTFFATLRPALAPADHATRTMAALLGTVFSIVAILVAVRVWFGMLPLLGGGS
jgi:hypothetical protein